MSLSDRIMVMNEGRNMGIVRRADTDIQQIGLMMAGVETLLAPKDESPLKMSTRPLPRWIDVGLLPLLNLLAALIVAGIIIAIIGENPFVAMGVMMRALLSIKARWAIPCSIPRILFSPVLRWRWRFMPCCSILAAKARP